MSRISARTLIASAGLAVGLGVLSPATASADAVDDLLNRFPSGQISCEQARGYWTNESDYNNKRAQAQAVAAFHPRGGEIRAALGRVEEAANRCGLKGGGAQQGPSQPAPQRPAPSQPAPQRPAPSQPAPSQPAQQQSPVIPVLVAPGTPAIEVPVPGVGTVALPDLVRIVTEFLGQFTLPAGSSLPR
ncbi:hypothetical protein [Corynebacterium sp.]|uniref:hypothetical protein n=1 Tax=Corynebacterium sp. TaxID=1720 RepID=UPI0026E105AE|nr:hypothetical protein [Corynebacterium sp.]MDO5513215.1 hypothetical protein [Corynebacterium sp.]